MVAQLDWGPVDDVLLAYAVCPRCGDAQIVRPWNKDLPCSDECDCVDSLPLPFAEADAIFRLGGDGALQEWVRARSAEQETRSAVPARDSRPDGG